jgi:hypothetical protein
VEQEQLELVRAVVTAYLILSQLQAAELLDLGIVLLELQVDQVVAVQVALSMKLI